MQKRTAAEGQHETPETAARDTLGAITDQDVLRAVAAGDLPADGLEALLAREAVRLRAEIDRLKGKFG